MFLEKAGFFVAAGIVAVCLALMSISFFVFENDVAGVAFGLAGATPIVLGFLGSQRPKENSENGKNGE